MSQVIVLGGGLAGLSAAHTVLEHGGRVLLLDKARAAPRVCATAATAPPASVAAGAAR
jgi:succinate dehydrogenase/fumarate reductase flavoprotein subunit